MKTDFKTIKDEHLKAGSVFYLYGNNKETFEVFCDFALEGLRKKYSAVRTYYCSVVECQKIIGGGQCDLFDTHLDCFCIKNLEDDHLEKVRHFFGEENSVFLLESGNYLRSKKITEHMWNSEVMAIASFNNDLTLHSLTRMFFPQLSQSIINEIVKLIANTDEDLCSLFRKLSIFLDDCQCNQVDLNDYVAHRQSFLEGLDLIPLIRFLLQNIIRKQISPSLGGPKITHSTARNTICRLLEAETMQKYGQEIGRGYIYSSCI
ncbi:MAG: hypothetical protein LBG20_01655 [Holosporaceae bacterium]|jgi:hypothetical protein|nr:hypothetical protein [Holosporaceae bacterium]